MCPESHLVKDPCNSYWCLWDNITSLNQTSGLWQLGQRSERDWLTKMQGLGSKWEICGVYDDISFISNWIFIATNWYNSIRNLILDFIKGYTEGASLMPLWNGMSTTVGETGVKVERCTKHKVVYKTSDEQALISNNLRPSICIGESAIYCLCRPVCML